MARRKKQSFKLDPEWMLKKPVDFEFNKYTLLDYLQKCENRFNNLEIYPDFVELSLHLANLQSLIKEKTILLTDKKFESCDDEILLKELYPKKPRTLTKEEEVELEKTIKYSGAKLFDTFNLNVFQFFKQKYLIHLMFSLPQYMHISFPLYLLDFSKYHLNLYKHQKN